MKQPWGSMGYYSATTLLFLAVQVGVFPRGSALTLCIYNSCFTHSNGKRRNLHKEASSQICEMRLIATPCLSDCPHKTTRLPLDGFS